LNTSKLATLIVQSNILQVCEKYLEIQSWTLMAGKISNPQAQSHHHRMQPIPPTLRASSQGGHQEVLMC